MSNNFRVFQNELTDKDYYQWMQTNKNGFVGEISDYIIHFFHRSGCYLISDPSPHSLHTTNGKKKVCSNDIEDIENWMDVESKGALNFIPCTKCNPTSLPENERYSGDFIFGNEKIWRYMDFPSFYSILLSKGLFFKRLDKYSDEYEGRVSDEIRDYLKRYVRTNPFYGGSQSVDDFVQGFVEPLEKNKSFTLSNSWVLNDAEIYAMWKIYLRGSTEGIAIRTTVEKFRDSLLNNKIIFLNKVRYEPKLEIPTFSSISKYKSKAYSYEQEFRALIYDQYTILKQPDGTEFKTPLYEYGRIIPVDLDKLIEEIHISPFTGKWFYEVVKSTIQSFMPTFDVDNIVYSRIKDM